MTSADRTGSRLGQPSLDAVEMKQMVTRKMGTGIHDNKRGQTYRAGGKVIDLLVRDWVGRKALNGRY